MDRFLVFVVICSLGGAYAGVVRRNAPSTQEIDGLKGLTDIASQLMTSLASHQPSQTTGTGSQPNADSTNGRAVESLFRALFSNNEQTMNYDLSEAMQMLNQSYGINARPSIDTSAMTNEQFLEHVRKQSNSFSNTINSKMTALLEPDRVVKFLNLTSRASDPTITNNPEALEALKREYQAMRIEFQNKLQEKVNGEKSSKPAEADLSTVSLETLQQQMAAMTSMYNTELSQAMKPDDIAGAMSGSEPEMNDITQNLGKAVMNIFQSISQGSGPSNQPLHWDSNKYN